MEIIGTVLAIAAMYGLVCFLVFLYKALSGTLPISLQEARSRMDQIQRNADRDLCFVMVSWKRNETNGQILKAGETHDSNINWLSAAISKLEAQRVQEAQAVHSAKKRAKDLGLTIVSGQDNEAT